MTTHSPAPNTPQTDHKARAAGNAAGPLGGVSFLLTSILLRWFTGWDAEMWGVPMMQEALASVIGGIVAYGAARIRAYQVPNQPLPGPNPHTNIPPRSTLGLLIVGVLLFPFDANARSGEFLRAKLYLSALATVMDYQMERATLNEKINVGRMCNSIDLLVENYDFQRPPSPIPEICLEVKIDLEMMGISLEEAA